MIDTEFERKGQAMSDELNQITDLEYTWGDFPAVTAEQIYNRYDVARETAQLRARVAELERERNAQNLTFATLCDMLGLETDRSDDALVRAVGELKRERELVNKCLGK